MPQSISNPVDSVLLLAIRPEFADRILDGRKRFELRKRLPSEPFARVYLYVSGGGGVVGVFDVERIYTLPPAELWRIVGEAATAENRFFAYFSGWPTGSAIKIKNPVRFHRPIYPPDLKRLEPKFIAPQSFLYIKSGTKLYAELERRRAETLETSDLAIRPIRKSEHSLYVSLVTRLISPRYDQIDEKFAKNNLVVNDLGYDPHGVLTETKEVLSITLRRKLIGFTTLTYKMGHSVKTGPTVLQPRYRGRGYGLRMRSLVERHVRRKGRNKLYCTCPDNDAQLIQHFIRAGFRIEGHLRAHYQATRGEIVLGKVLLCGLQPQLTRQRELNVSASPEEMSSESGALVAAAIASNFEKTWFAPPSDFGVRIVKAAARSAVEGYEQKPLDVIRLMAADRCVGVVLLVHKRGGAVKGLILTETADAPTIKSLISKVERYVKAIPKRKLYFVHPLNDPTINTLLVEAGYQIEAVLEEPYAVGQDALVFARLL